MSKTNRNTWLASLLVVGMAVPAISLAAAPSQIDKETVKVSYADLNIQSEAGAKVLYTRLKKASQEVCGIQSTATR